MVLPWWKITKGILGRGGGLVIGRLGSRSRGPGFNSCSQLNIFKIICRSKIRLVLEWGENNKNNLSWAALIGLICIFLGQMVLEFFVMFLQSNSSLQLNQAVVSFLHQFEQIPHSVFSNKFHSTRFCGAIVVWKRALKTFAEICSKLGFIFRSKKP